MNPAPPSPAPARPRGAPWIPITITALGVISAVVVLSLPNFERNLTRWVVMGIPLLVLPLNLVWFLLTPRYSWRTRGLGLLILLGLGLAFRASVKVDGTSDGTGMPRLAWKWSGKNRSSLTTPPVTTGNPTTVTEDPRLAQVRDIPQFFGPAGDGLITGAKLARDWKTQPPRELWRQPIGEGWSAFAVVQGRAFTQEQRGEDELVTCYELLTGKLLWAHADKVRFSQWQSGDGPHGTPAVSGDRVFTYGGTGLLNCLDTTSGRLIWQRDVLTENKSGNLEWGMSVSPLLVDDKVVVTAGKSKGPVLFSYSQATGAPVWQAGEDKATYASPVLTTLAGRRVILCNHGRSLTAHDPATGQVLMEYPWGNEKWPKASQPVVVDGQHIFVSAGYGVGCHMVDVTAAPDGKLTASEAWSNLKMKTQFNSVAVRGGFLYGLDDGRLACVEAATGERKWKEGRYASGQSLLVDDLAIVQNEDGPVHLCLALPDQYEELGRIDALSTKTWNHPVLAGRFLLVRNDRVAVCYELPVLP